MPACRQGGLRAADALLEGIVDPVVNFINDSPSQRAANDRVHRWFRSRAAQGEALAAISVGGSTPWSEVPSIPDLIWHPSKIGKVARFATETSIQSLPGTLFAVTNPVGASIANSGQIAQNRATNNKRDTAKIGDLLKAAPAGTISSFLDRYGFESIIGAEGKNALIRTIKASGTEAATEFSQGIIENAGATVGTDQGFDVSQALDQGLQGALGSLGTSLGIKVPQEVGHKAIDIYNAKRQAAFLDEIAAASLASKTRPRDEQTYEDLVSALAENSAAEFMYIPADRVRNYIA